MRGTTEKVFRRTSFRNMKEWIYFCLEFDLELCVGCFSNAHKRCGDEFESWYCGDCAPPIHRDLLRAIQQRSNVATHCHLCGDETPLRDSWISEDCQRLYCSKHLETTATGSCVVTHPTPELVTQSGPNFKARESADRHPRRHAVSRVSRYETKARNGEAVFERTRFSEID